MSGIDSIDSVGTETVEWSCMVVDVGAHEVFRDGARVQQTRKEDGMPRWAVTLLVNRPGRSGLEQMSVKLYAPAKPEFVPQQQVRFVNDRIIAHPWGTSQVGSDRTKVGLWFEHDGLEAVD